MVKPLDAGVEEHPDELRRKLALLDGDRKAYYESSQAMMTQNKDAVNSLRKENKLLAMKLKSLKAASGATRGDPDSIQRRMDQKICEQVGSHNAIRHKVQQKMKRIEALQSQLHRMEDEKDMLTKNSGGETPQAKALRDLENKYDKAMIKYHEAHHIGATYDQIIEKLKLERLEFDNRIEAFEKQIKKRDTDIVDLERLLSDAQLARDMARKDLSAAEAKHTERRRQRHAERKELTALSEERRRQYEAMERRMNANAVKDRTPDEDEGVAPEVRDKMMTYEQAMKRIQEATGVTDVQEVVERFSTQGETCERLQQLQTATTEKLAKLREENERITKEYESLKYSGEARNTSNQRTLAEFEKHLQVATERAETNKTVSERSTRVLVDVQTGVDNLHEKVDNLPPVQFRNAANVHDKLKETELRLVALQTELDSRKAEVETAIAETGWQATPLVLPEYNTRVVLETKAPVKGNNNNQGGDESDSDEEELVSRDQMKRHAQTLVDSKSKKKAGGGGSPTKKGRK